MAVETLSHIERWCRSLRREPFDRVPVGYHASAEFCAKMEQRTGLPTETFYRDVIGVDGLLVAPPYIGPEPRKYDDGSFDNLFGVRMRKQSYGAGEYCEAVAYPLAEARTRADVEAHNWPSPELHDFESIVGHLRENIDRQVTLGYFALGWYSWDTRGMSRFLMDLSLEPDLADAIISRVSDFGYEYFRLAIDAARDYIGRNVTTIHLADDWATQDGLLISPDTFRKFFKPHYSRIIDLAHAAELRVEFHCCGSVFGLIPELIDLGVDILNPIQTSARDMEPERLKSEFGKTLAFSGGMDVQTELPFGTPQSVADRTHYLLDTLGRDGGFIFGPSHSIQVDTPVENVLAAYSAVYDHYGIANDALAC